MPHISSKQINEKDFKKIYNELVSIFGNAGKNGNIVSLFEEFLTDTEKIMLAKRLAVICMIYEEMPISYIWEILSMSPSTVTRISLGYEQGAYSVIIKLIKENRQTVWDTVEEIIRNNIEKQTGKGRWKKLNKLSQKNNFHK